MQDDYPGVEKMGLLGPVIKNSLKLMHAKQIGKEMLTGGMMGGNQRVSPRSMKGETMSGRKNNLEAKAAFKSGSVCGE